MWYKIDGGYIHVPYERPGFSPVFYDEENQVISFDGQALNRLETNDLNEEGIYIFKLSEVLSLIYNAGDGSVMSIPRLKLVSPDGTVLVTADDYGLYVYKRQGDQFDLVFNQAADKPDKIQADWDKGLITFISQPLEDDHWSNLGSGRKIYELTLKDMALINTMVYEPYVIYKTMDRQQGLRLESMEGLAIENLHTYDLVDGQLVLWFKVTGDQEGYIYRQIQANDFVYTSYDQSTYHIRTQAGMVDKEIKREIDTVTLSEDLEEAGYVTFYSNWEWEIGLATHLASGKMYDFKGKAYLAPNKKHFVSADVVYGAGDMSLYFYDLDEGMELKQSLFMGNTGYESIKWLDDDHLEVVLYNYISRQKRVEILEKRQGKWYFLD